jgi:hypothetical protein
VDLLVNASAKPLIIRSVFGTSLANAVFVACQPDEAYDRGGSPVPGSRTLLLRLRGQRLTYFDEVPFNIVTTFLSASGVAYCGSVQSGTLYKWQSGQWSEEVFSKKPVEVIRCIFAVPGKTPEEDTVFLATPKQIFIRQGGNWKGLRAPGEGFPFQMDGSRADQVFIGAEPLCLWDGQKLQELEPPDDDTISALALTADDRLVGGNTYVNISTPDGVWERIETGEDGIYCLARFNDDVYGLSDESGVIKVYPGRATVVSPVVVDPTGLFPVGDGMVATGEGVLAFDGKNWFPVEVPLCDKKIL